MDDNNKSKRPRPRPSWLLLLLVAIASCVATLLLLSFLSSSAKKTKTMTLAAPPPLLQEVVVEQEKEEEEEEEVPGVGVPEVGVELDIEKMNLRIQPPPRSRFAYTAPRMNMSELVRAVPVKIGKGMRPKKDVAYLASQDWVRHAFNYSSPKGTFLTIGAYVIDGDRNRPSFSAKTSDILIVVVGAGDLTDTPFPSANTPPMLPNNLICDIDLHGRKFQTVAVLHVNGTHFQNARTSKGSMKHTGERAIWISCFVPYAFVSEEELYITRFGDISGMVTVREFDPSDDVLQGPLSAIRGHTSHSTAPKARYGPATKRFSTGKTSLQWFLSDDATARELARSKRHLVFCSAPIYGLTGTRWLIEYIEYYRAVGFDHLHLYFFSPPKAVLSVIEYYRTTGFITPHDWSKIDTGGIKNVEIRNWEHGQRLSRNDCYLRNRGASSFVVFGDVDELFYSPKWNTAKGETLEIGDPSASDEENTPNVKTTILKWCEEEHQRNVEKIAFSFESVTVPPNRVEISKEHPSFNVGPHPLFLDQISISETHCEPPYNCGNFHYGRSKYLVRTSYGTINPNGPLFYHAISENYPEVAEKLHAFVPPDVGVVRHYAGHFKHSRLGGLSKSNSLYNPISPRILWKMSQKINQDSMLTKLYLESPPEEFLKLSHSDDFWRFAHKDERK